MRQLKGPPRNIGGVYEIVDAAAAMDNESAILYIVWTSMFGYKKLYKKFMWLDGTDTWFFVKSSPYFSW